MRPERRICPQHYQERIARAGGLNRYGQPNFELVWGQTAKIRVDRRDILHLPEPCWMLRQWKAPETYGSPLLFSLENPGQEYPARGRYEIVQPFKWAGMINGKLVVEYMELNSMLVDMVIPIIKRASDATYWQRFTAIRDEAERKENEQVNRIADSLKNASPAWTGPVSYSRQGCRTSIINKKIEQIEQNWKRAMYLYHLLPKKGPSVFRQPV